MYTKQLYLALFGVGVCVLPAVLPLVPKIQNYAVTQRLKAEAELQAETLRNKEELKRIRITERAKTSEELFSKGIAPNTSTLRIRRYFDNPKQDPKPDTTGWGADEVVYVYDSSGLCIGRIESEKWLWKHRIKNACNGRPSN